MDPAASVAELGAAKLLSADGQCASAECGGGGGGGVVVGLVFFEKRRGVGWMVVFLGVLRNC